MKDIISNSDSIFSSLCREIESISGRTKSINNSLINCQNQLLVKRLKKELIELKTRRNNIYSFTKLFNNKNCKDDLSIEFLAEVIGRGLVNV